MPSFLENIFRRQIATNACPGEIRYDTTWCEAKITSSGAHLSAQDPKSAETRRNALCGACTSRRLERCRRLKRYVLNARSACHHSMHHSCLAHLLTPLRPQSSNECGRVRHSRKVDDLHAFHRIFLSTPPFARVGGVVLQHRKKCIWTQGAIDNLT